MRKIFRVGYGKCQKCGHIGDLFMIADSRRRAERIYDEIGSGLCGNCILKEENEMEVITIDNEIELFGRVWFKKGRGKIKMIIDNDAFELNKWDIENLAGFFLNAKGESELENEMEVIV